jgi:hypothetical protein
VITSGATGTSGGSGGAVTIANGADVTEGAIADVAVIGDTPGTISAKLRGLLSTLNGVAVAGNLSVNGGTLELNTRGMGALSIWQPGVAGGWDGTLNLEATNDGTNWFAVKIARQDDGQLITSFSNTSFVLRVNVAAFERFQLRVSARTVGNTDITMYASPTAYQSYTAASIFDQFTGNHLTIDASGSARVTIRDDAGTLFGQAANPLRIDPTGTTTQPVQQGTPGSNAQAWWTQIGDTSTGPVNVTLPTVSAVAADRALVVAVSPNTPILLTQPDTVSPGVAFDNPSASVDVDLAGYHGVGFILNPGTFVGTLVAELLFSAAVLYVPTKFLDPTTLEETDSLMLTGDSISSISKSILIAGGATNVRVRASAYGSGSSTGRLIATVATNPYQVVRHNTRATDASPFYQEAAFSVFSQDRSGNLRVTDAPQLAWLKTQPQDALDNILRELRVITYYLQTGLNVKDEPEQLRADYLNL